MAWFLDAGVDETIGEVPQDRYAASLALQDQRKAAAQAVLDPARQGAGAQKPVPVSATKSGSGSPRIGPALVRPVETEVAKDALKRAVELAAAAQTLDDLRAALDGFDGCPLKKNAMNLVFGAGASDARLLLVGEAPEGDDDRQGVPFAGENGLLLDKMLAAIGLARADVFMTNTVFWRPPGNRTPLAGELAVCLPFVERMIELIDPAVLIAVGGAPAQSLMGKQGSVSRLRGHWFSYETGRMTHPIAASVLYHPKHLRATPAHKRHAWADLLAIRAKLAQ